MPANRIGLGCVTFGREIEEAASHRLLDHAFAHGITHFDTAAAYGQGASERILGTWLASRRPANGAVSIATKALPPYDPQAIEASVAQSCERLGVETIDLFYLHRWDAAVTNVETLAALDSLVKRGRVRRLGASNFSIEQLESALRLQQQNGFEPFRVVQNNHNVAVRDVTAAYRDFCAKQNIAIVTYSPLGAGFLTGKHQHGVAAGSRFDLVPGHQGVYFNDTAWTRLAVLQAVAQRTGYSTAHLALAWALHQPGLDCVLVGGRTPAHLDQALAARGFDDPAIFAELEAA